MELLNAAAHNKPGLVQEHLEVALPELYKQTDIDESLIKTVDLGPFKHKIDDGLELRKVAFECMDVIFGTCPGSIDYNAFMGPLNSGLGVSITPLAPQLIHCTRNRKPMSERCEAATLDADVLCSPEKLYVILAMNL